MWYAQYHTDPGGWGRGALASQPSDWFVARDVVWDTACWSQVIVHRYGRDDEWSHETSLVNSFNAWHTARSIAKNPLPARHGCIVDTTVGVISSESGHDQNFSCALCAQFRPPIRQLVRMPMKLLSGSYSLIRMDNKRACTLIRYRILATTRACRSWDCPLKS